MFWDADESTHFALDGLGRLLVVVPRVPGHSLEVNPVPVHHVAGGKEGQTVKMIYRTYRSPNKQNSRLEPFIKKSKRFKNYHASF